MPQKQKCFIIAPISTLEERVPLYHNDGAHCEHVIDHLLAPAVEKAGFDPIKPKAKGANLIHAEIVGNLQTASLVLCDMSGLNPNVFFELGIRTAMNKPICLVIDEATKEAPFDLNAINHHAYVSDLRPWVLPGEVEKLAKHIVESAAEKENALWKYFSLRIAAEPTDTKPNEGNDLSLLRMEVEALRRDLRADRPPIYESDEVFLLGNPEGRMSGEQSRALLVRIDKLARNFGLKVIAGGVNFGRPKVVLQGSASPEAVERFKSMFGNSIEIEILNVGKNES